MSRRLHFLFGVSTAFGLLASARAESVKPIPAADLQRLHALMKPSAEEDKWVQIPWLTSLWEARRKAAAEGKPILLWEMDGHPLGCT